MTSPLTTYLTEVKLRAEAATDEYTLGRIEERDNICINVPCPPSDSGLKKWPLCEFYGGVADPRADANFILHSRTDVTRLLKIVEVLSAGVKSNCCCSLDSGVTCVMCDLLHEAETIAKGEV